MVVLWFLNEALPDVILGYVKCLPRMDVCYCARYIKMSSPNMNNVILMGAILIFTSIIFNGTDSSLVDESAHLVMCKVC